MAACPWCKAAGGRHARPVRGAGGGPTRRRFFLASWTFPISTSRARAPKAAPKPAPRRTLPPRRQAAAPPPCHARQEGGGATPDHGSRFEDDDDDGSWGSLDLDLSHGPPLVSRRRRGPLARSPGPAAVPLPAPGAGPSRARRRSFQRSAGRWRAGRLVRGRAGAEAGPAPARSIPTKRGRSPTTATPPRRGGARRSTPTACSGGGPS